MTWANNADSLSRGFLTPPPTWRSRPRLSPSMPKSERKWSSPPVHKDDNFHVIHKVPVGDSPYVKAKQVQLIDKDPGRAISLFWAAINASDRVDSALKDMAIVMKQLNRADEAIEAIKSFRHLCPYDSQGSLDNVLVELYKRSGRIEEEIEMLQRKLKSIEEGTAFSGKRTKIARSQGKKIQITIEQEKSRILGNLAWAFLQLNNYTTAEELYREALSLEADKNKECNLAICLMHTNRIAEAKSLLHAVKASSKVKELDDSCVKSLERAWQMLAELESQSMAQNEADRQNTPLSVRNSLMCSPQTTFVDSPVGTNTSSACKIERASPASVGRKVKDPLIEPRRRCSWGFSKREQRRGIWDKNAVGSSHRKLSFDQSVTYENMQAPNIKKQPPTSTWSKDMERLETAFAPLITKRESNLQPKGSGDWRSPWNGSGYAHGQNGMTKSDSQSVLSSNVHAQLQNGMGIGSVSQPVVNRDDQKMTSSLEKDCEKTKLPREASMKFDDARSPETIVCEGKTQPVRNSVTSRNKKSWADMVEEEEESLSGRTDFLDDLLLQEASFSFLAVEEEEFNNENLDSNRTQQCPRPPSQIQMLSKKVETFSMEDGYNTSGKVGASMAKRALHFKDPKERGSVLWKSVNHQRKSRLQVFQDITDSM